MKAITWNRKSPDSPYEEVPEPDAQEARSSWRPWPSVFADRRRDRGGKYGWAPPGKTRLMLGHESLGRVIDPGPAVRSKRAIWCRDRPPPDPVPCVNCAVGEWDMCRNGQYTERGIKEIHGFMSERWRIEPEYTIKVDPTLGVLGVLLEPATVVTKAWAHVISSGSSLLGAADRSGDRAGRSAFSRSHRRAARAGCSRP